MIRALLPQAPLGANLILGNSATVQLTCDCYSKSESDSRYATPADLDVISCTSLTATSFVNTLNFAATGNVTGVDALFTADVQTPLLRAVSGDGYLRVAAGLVGTQFLDSGAAVIAEMTSSQIALEQDVNVAQGRTLTCASIATTGGVPNLQVQGGTQGIVCTSKGLNVTENFPLSANPTEGTVAVRVENTAPTGFASLEMSANGGAGFVQLETPATGGCTLYAPNQEIWLQNRTSGAAPLVVETDSDVTVNYSFNNLSDEKVKTNIADADLDTLQGIFDGAHPKTYDRTDIEHHNRLGFLAQDFLGAGVTGKTYRDGEELLTLDYSRLTAVLWGVVKKLQARVEALEKKKRGRS